MLASRLQRDFLPRNLPEIPGFKFATIYRPATWVSGDIYDIMRLDEEHVGFYVADAVGHGMPAALLTMFIKRALVTKRIRGNEYCLIEPGMALAQLNTDMVSQDLSNFQFATCCYGILNTKTLRLRVANAGHPPPMLINGDAQTSELVRGIGRASRRYYAPPLNRTVRGHSDGAWIPGRSVVRLEFMVVSRATGG